MHTSSQPSLLGGILLVAGCSIGAGMLGLPVLSGGAGFWPSVLIFFLCWSFMASTGLLLLEVNLWHRHEASIITMAGSTLGRFGRVLSWVIFLFLFYSLMVAYVAASGTLVKEFVELFTGASLHSHLGGVFFSCVFGVLLYFGTYAVDWFNRLLMLGLVLSYLSLVIVGMPFVDTALLQHKNWSLMTLAIPAVIVSFGFHNLIPSLTAYFHGSLRLLKSSILLGSALPLLIYLVWEAMILGLVPPEGFQTALNNGEIATEAIKSAVGSSWVALAAEIFAFFSIVTSFLSVSLSFVDFLADGLNIKKTAKGKIFLALLVLLPPLILSFLYPAIFLTALNAAGGFGAVILFGILPVLMVWRGRYVQKKEAPQLLFGGKPMLVILLLFAVWVMTLQF